MKRRSLNVKSNNSEHKNNDEEEKNVKKSLKKLVFKGKAPVDSFCTSKIDVAHVYFENNTDIYDVLLNQTNLQNNNNKYYIIQLLKDNDANNYSVWYRWGRVGKAGQNKLENYGSCLQDAIDAFCTKFYDKTLNTWDRRMNFVKHNGKYDMVKIDYGSQDQNTSPVVKKEPVESILPISVQDLMKLICDLSNMQATVTELQYDSRRAPLGKLSKTQLSAGYSALDDITKVLTDLENLKQIQSETRLGNRSGRRVSINIGQKKKLEVDLLAACNNFYTRIPHDFGMCIPPLIRTMDEVKTKLELLQALEDIDFAIKFMKDDSNETENLVDVHYKRLACDIKPLERSNKIYKILEEFVKINHGPTHNWYELEVLDLFDCRRPEESDRFEDVGNRMLLWHGSRLTNWVGILGRGLKIAPPEAPVTGYMFGKGVYFADCSSKSANYIYPTHTKNVGIIAACEVSLGVSKEIFEACSDVEKQLNGCSSVKGIGKLQPDPQTWQTLDDGLTIPCGKMLEPPNIDVSECALQFNEYVVYNVNQIRIRYLVKVKFNFEQDSSG